MKILENPENDDICNRQNRRFREMVAKHISDGNYSSNFKITVSKLNP